MIDFNEAPLTDEPALRKWVAEKVGTQPYNVSFLYMVRQKGIRGIMTARSFQDGIDKWRGDNPEVVITISIWSPHVRTGAFSVVVDKEGGFLEAQYDEL